MIPGSANSLLLASAAAAGGYQVERSLRFNSADSAYLSRTPASAGNRRTFTLSFWYKRSNIATSVEQAIFTTNTTYDGIRIENNSDKLRFFLNGAASADILTTQVFRDPSAWYHFLIAVDTTQGTASNRIKIYANGTQITTFDTSTYPSQNYDCSFNSTNQHVFGFSPTAGTHYLNGYLADIHFIDGQALTPSSFTEVSATTGQLIPKTYSGSYGTNGFQLKFADNSSNTAATLGKDTSGNSNNWTPNNFTVSLSNNVYGDFYSAGYSQGWINKAGSGVLTAGGDVTIEAWIYPRSSSFLGLFDGGYGELNILRNYPQNTIAKVGDEATGAVFTVTVNAWQHFAATITGGSIKVYINGILNASGTYSGGTYSGGSNFSIGSINTNNMYGGLIRNFRVTKSIVYSANFTPPSFSTNLAAIANTSLLALTTGLGDFSSNNYTLTNYDAQIVTPAGNDSLVDTPTSISATDTGVGGEIRGNYCTLNPLDKNTNAALVDGNLTLNGSSAGWYGAKAGFGMSSGKWYFEVTCTSGDTMLGIGDSSSGVATPAFPGYKPKSYGYYSPGTKFNNDVSSAYGASYGAGDVIGIAFDADNGTLTYYKNGTSQGVAFSSIPSDTYFPYVATYNTIYCNFGQRPFAYQTPGTNRPAATFKALCDTNLGAPVVAKPNTLMDVSLWTGNGTQTIVSGLQYSPDFVWIKSRSTTAYHMLFDVVRGAQARLHSNTTDQEQTGNNDLTSFNSDGYTLDNNSSPANTDVNGSGITYVGWSWDAGSSTVTNTQGSITSQVRANASAGFSVVTYSGNSSAGATFGHGLGVAPQMVFIKNRNGIDNWSCYHASLGNNKLIQLNNTNAAFTSGDFNNTSPTSSVFSLSGGFGNNYSGYNYVAYCWAPLSGYSSFGSYTGNGSATDNTFVYTGMRPRFVMLRRGDSTGNWVIWDAVRNSYNVANSIILPNSSAAEYSPDAKIDILSNGFKVRDNSSDSGTNGATYIYAAFAESPFAYARAR